MVRKEKSRLAVEVAEIYPRQGEWKEEDYFALPDTTRLIELSEGEITVHPPGTEIHQRTLGSLVAGLHAYTGEGHPEIIRFAPMPVRLWPGKIREPDILFLLKEHSDRAGEKYYGVPDLVVEVVSPSTARADRGEKFLEYAQAGVSEYWQVDPGARTVEVFVSEGGVFILASKSGPGEAARSKLLDGFVIAVDDVFVG